MVKLPGTRRNGGRRKSPRAKPARGELGENVGAPTFKVLLEGYLILTKLSNEFADVLERKQLALGIRMVVFPKWAK